MPYAANLIEVGNEFIAGRKEREPFTEAQRDLMRRSMIRKGTDKRVPSCVFVDSPELRDVLGINFGKDREW